MKQKNNLYQKLQYSGHGFYIFLEEDVKDSLNKFLIWLNSNYIQKGCRDINNKAEEIFGKEMVKQNETN